MLLPVGTAMLYRAFPPHERAKASTVLLIPAVIAPATGPIIGGWLVTDVSWRWIFYVNLPIGLAGFLVGFFFLHEYKEGSAGRFDVWGFLLSGGGLALLLFSLSQGPDKGWRSPEVVLTGLVGVLMFTALVYVEMHIEDPMLALRLYRERMFRNANIVLTLTYGSFAGVLFLLPLFLQGLLGLTALQSGLTTFPQAIGIIISTQLVGRLYARVGPRRLIFFGMLGMSIITFCFVFIDLHTSLWWVRGIMFVRGIFMAFSFVPLQASTFSNISAADTGRASAIFSTQRQVAASIGVAALATIWISRTKSLTAGLRGPRAIASAQVSGFHAAFFTATVLVVLAAISALLIRDEDAASSMRKAPAAEAALDAA
jgi:EmrB/QacA subfamily drug resistance transporter